MVDLVIQQEPKKTEEEAEVAFNQIPLTDNQRGVKKRKKWNVIYVVIYSR